MSEGMLSRAKKALKKDPLNRKTAKGPAKKRAKPTKSAAQAKIDNNIRARRAARAKKK